MEANNLNYVGYHQGWLRVENDTGLADHIANYNDGQVGRMVILSSSFQGSPHNMKERYHDPMAIVAKYGKPDLFIAMTCNPPWHEIKKKKKIFSRDKKSAFGEVLAYCYSTEFQKQELPIAHILIILENKEIFCDPNEIDEIVCAEIPSPETESNLHDTVIKCHLHGPCGMHNPNATCMDGNKCSKGYPKDF